MNVIGEWDDNAGHHQIIKTKSGDYIFITGQDGGGIVRPIEAHKVWEIFPEVAPGWWREQRWQAAQEERRRRVWWRRILREAGWR